MKNYMSLFDSCVFAFDGAKCIMESKDIGIAADVASMRVPDASVAAMNCFQGCPYTCTSFDFDVMTDGEKVKCSSWTWLPNAILRRGKSENFSLETVTAVVPQSRTAVMKLTVTSLLDHDVTVPLTVMFRGRTRKENEWTFIIPSPETGDRSDYSACPCGRMLSSVHDGAAFRLTSSLDGMRLFLRAYLWENEITVPAGGTTTVYFSAHMGEEKASLAEAEYALSHYEELIERSFAYLEKEVARIHDNLPHLKSDCAELDEFYSRSLVSYIICRWENPDLCAIPYYSTGSINGGCMCSYLWDYCGGLMMHPLYDPEGNKKQICAYLRNDLSKSYALNPVTSGPVGPWYQVNQEKVIQMVYHHIRATGDLAFLNETVGDRTVLEWMRYHAYVCDDVTKDVELYDYGRGGNAHLELHTYEDMPYNGVMPDLNARRYMNYMLVYELTKLAGKPDELLPKRAAALKEKLKTLWNDETKWYDHIDATGKRDTRYTIQMFKFLNSPVIGQYEREALLSHINETEFLSKFGMHSMSKLDPAYDQDDIDNGGGGSCHHLRTEVCARLYEIGEDALATDILRRIYWWTSREPYMGDSVAANMIRNRETTPLQGNIHAIGCAQMVFFSIFGVKPNFDGTVEICPVKNRPAENMEAENVRLCGKVFGVKITGDTFTVVHAGKESKASVGEKIII